MSESLVLLGIIIAATSGLAGLFWGKTSMAGQWVAALLGRAGGRGLAWAASARSGLTGDSATDRSGPGRFPAPSSTWASTACRPSSSRRFFWSRSWATSTASATGSRPSTRKTAGSCGSSTARMTAGMALLVIARNGILFLFGWEIMAISAFFLVATEDDETDVREAGWLYLVATHTATLCLFAVFALLHAVTGSFTLAPLARGTIVGRHWRPRSSCSPWSASA